MDTAVRKKIAFTYVLWGSLVLGLALVVLAYFLTSSIPQWAALIGQSLKPGWVLFS
jgi:hypothetical protein